MRGKKQRPARIAKRLQIILDANAFYDDPNLTGADAKLLGEYIGSRHAGIIVPQVVFDEVVKKFRERLELHVEEIRSANRKVIWLTEQGYNAALPSANLEDLHESYKSRLNSRLAVWGAAILPYPSISHKKLAGRDLGRRKPFSEGGRGYRDALIWESVLENLDKKGAYVLVTANHKDFCKKGDPRVLHEDLMRDLQDKSFSGSFAVRAKLDEVLDEIIKPTLPRSDRVKHDLQRANYAPLDLRKFLTENFETVLDGIGDKLQLEFAHVDVDEPYGVSGLYDPDEIEVADVIELSNGALYIDLRVQYEADVYAYVYKSDAYGLTEEHTFPLEVSDWDWNESYVEVSGTIGLDVSIEITFDPQSNEEPRLEVREARNRSNDARDNANSI